LRREVAVKVLPFHLAMQQPDLVKRFFREAQMAARVQSPHLVSVLDVNEDHGLHYLVMEYVHGLTGGVYLKSRQRQESRRGLPESEVLEIGVATCQGLSAAHARGVVHRDIKVDNILLPWAEPGQRVNLRAAKLADLGLGRSEEPGETLTGTQATLGTPGYMAPEQASDARRAGPPADVFSLGATLYALLTGRAPFIGSSAFEVLLATAQKPHAPVLELRPDISATTAAVIDRCLQKAPEHRYGNAMELLEALRACVVAPESDAGRASAPTPMQQSSPVTPAPVYAVPQTPPVAPLTPATGQSPSSAPTAVAPVTASAPRRHTGLWIAGSLVVILVLAACGGWLHFRTQREWHLSLAREALERRDWSEAKSECEEALRFSFLQDTTETRGLLDRALEGSRFTEEMTAAAKHVRAGAWKAAEGAYARALAIKGFGKDRDATKGLEEVRRQLTFRDTMRQAEARRAAGDWVEAKRLFEQALHVPGFGTDAKAVAGRREAENTMAYEDAVARARAAVVVGNWADALRDVGRAQAIPGFEQHATAGVLQAQARNGASFEQARANAERLLGLRQFKRAATAFEEAAVFAREPSSPILFETATQVQNGKTLASLLVDAEDLLKQEQWSQAQAVLKTVSALPGFNRHPAAAELADEARRGQLFAGHLVEGQGHLEKSKWPEALAAFNQAREVQGFEDDLRAHRGAEKAQRGATFVKTLDDARKDARAGEWARAQAAYQRALAIEGFGDHQGARDGLKEASVQLERLGKEQAYRKALAEAQRLRKAVPAGPREEDAWAGVRRAARAAIDTKHTDVRAAQELYDEAHRAEQAAKGWLESDRKLMEARTFAKQGAWSDASEALKQALAAAPRTDTADLQTTLAKGLAQAQGRSYWEGDRKYLDYKGRQWLTGVRGRVLAKDPFIGSVRLKPGTGPTLLWVRVAEKEYWFLRDKTNDMGVGFQIIRNENKKDASKTERTEWVGRYHQEEDKWVIEMKMFRQYDKQNGGSGSIYPDSSKAELSVQPGGAVLYQPRMFKAHPMERVSQEVPDEMARRAIDAYLAKWTGSEK